MQAAERGLGGSSKNEENPGISGLPDAGQGASVKNLNPQIRVSERQKTRGLERADAKLKAHIE